VTKALTRYVEAIRSVFFLDDHDRHHHPRHNDNKKLSKQTDSEFDYNNKEEDGITSDVEDNDEEGRRHRSHKQLTPRDRGDESGKAPTPPKTLEVLESMRKSSRVVAKSSEVIRSLNMVAQKHVDLMETLVNDITMFYLNEVFHFLIEGGLPCFDRFRVLFHI